MQNILQVSNDVNPTRPEIYYTLDNKLYALELETLKHRLLYTPPVGYNVHGGLVGADGKYVYSVIQEDLSDKIYANLSASYIGMSEVFKAKPIAASLKPILKPEVTKKFIRNTVG